MVEALELHQYLDTVYDWTVYTLRCFPETRHVKARELLVIKVREISKQDFAFEAITRCARKIQNELELFLVPDDRIEREVIYRNHFRKTGG